MCAVGPVAARSGHGCPAGPDSRDHVAEAVGSEEPPGSGAAFKIAVRQQRHRCARGTRATFRSSISIPALSRPSTGYVPAGGSGRRLRDSSIGGNCSNLRRIPRLAATPQNRLSATNSRAIPGWNRRPGVVRPTPAGCVSDGVLRGCRPHLLSFAGVRPASPAGGVGTDDGNPWMGCPRAPRIPRPRPDSRRAGSPGGRTDIGSVSRPPIRQVGGTVPG